MAQRTGSERTTVGRREFLKGAAAMAAAVGAMKPLFTIAEEAAKGANDRPGVGFIGCGGRAGAHMHIVNALKSQGKAEPVAACDVYGPRAKAAAQNLGVKEYRSHKELLADPKVDVVCIATPDRLHAPQAIDAVKAGKDVYVEKPLTHWSQFSLARQLAEETEKNKRIVQVGTQGMATESFWQIREILKTGVIGKLIHAQAGYFRFGDWGEAGMPIPDKNAKPGADLDWEAFLGDAPKVDYDVSRFFRWRLYWDYAGGPCTDVLVHTFTPVFVMIGADYPERVTGNGGKWHFAPPREVPDTFNLTIDYPGGPSVVLMSTFSNEYGVAPVIRGTNGVVTFEGGKLIVRPRGAKEPSHQVPCGGWGDAGDTGKLWTNFLDCVKSRQKPLSPVDVGARVQAPLNMSILSYRESKFARFDKEKQEIVL
jgi:predicted dehydrogenase